MAKNSGSTSNVPVPSPLTADAVTDWLENNPEFMADNADFVARLLPNRFGGGEGVVDMQNFVLNRLRTEIAEKNSREKSLIQAAEANVMVQERVHRAVIALLKADSLDAVVSLITEDLPDLFDVEAAVLCLETDVGLPGGVKTVEGGAMDTLTQATERVVLRADIEGSDVLFGPLADDIQSMALMRLDCGPSAPRGVLVLGATGRSAFHPRQGTELLAFFADALQLTIGKWLSAENQ